MELQHLFSLSTPPKPSQEYVFHTLLNVGNYGWPQSGSESWELGCLWSGRHGSSSCGRVLVVEKRRVQFEAW